MNEVPHPPRPPVSPPRQRGSWLAILLAGIFCLGMLVVLSFLTMGYFLPVLAIGGLIFLMTGLHYFVWGWWMSRLLRPEAEEE